MSGAGEHDAPVDERAERGQLFDATPAREALDADPRRWHEYPSSDLVGVDLFVLANPAPRHREMGKFMRERERGRTIIATRPVQNRRRVVRDKHPRARARRDSYDVHAERVREFEWIRWIARVDATAQEWPRSDALEILFVKPHDALIVRMRGRAVDQRFLI